MIIKKNRIEYATSYTKTIAVKGNNFTYFNYN